MSPAATQGAAVRPASREPQPPRALSDNSILYLPRCSSIATKDSPLSRTTTSSQASYLIDTNPNQPTRPPPPRADVYRTHWTHRPLSLSLTQRTNTTNTRYIYPNHGPLRHQRQILLHLFHRSLPQPQRRPWLLAPRRIPSTLNPQRENRRRRRLLRAT